jgi:ADP-ribosylglycohydrolase
MFGAIIGDIAGSIYEWRPIKHKDFPLLSKKCFFTDDTVLTVAIAQSILTKKKYLESVREIGRHYPNSGYGGSFGDWLYSPVTEPYNSWGNGSAMRVSPVGFAFNTTEDVLREAKNTSIITHDHPEGIKGAQATALAVFLARTGHSKEAIRAEIQSKFKYNLDRTVDDIRPNYRFDVSCRGTVPEAIIAFLDSVSYEDAIRNAISLGGDADTLACIAGGIAEAFYGDIPNELIATAKNILTSDLLEIVELFCDNYNL